MSVQQVIRGTVAAVCAVLAAGCQKEVDLSGDSSLSTIFFCSGQEYGTKSNDPEETLISDINLFVFTADNILVDKKFLPKRMLSRTGEGVSCTLRLLKNSRYAIYACANLGYALASVNSLEDLMQCRYYMTYPDEYREGIPMSGFLQDVLIGENESIEVSLTRLLSRISLRIDRTALDPDVRFTVRSIQIGGCPRSALLFGRSKAETARDIFASGFTKNGNQVDNLNADGSLGLSREVSLYLFENMQGNLLSNVRDDKGKVFPDGDLRAEVCSFVEIHADYYSSDYYSGRDQYLIYRFYLGEGPDNFDVERNCHYHITVRPEGSGLSESSWRVDKSRLGVRSKSGSWNLYPSNYNECMPGDTCHIWCETDPETTAVTFDRQWLQDEVERGLIEYEMDADGRGVQIYAKERGTAVFYISAGPPVNKDTVALLVIDPTVIINPQTL